MFTQLQQKLIGACSSSTKTNHLSFQEKVEQVKLKMQDFA